MKKVIKIIFFTLLAVVFIIVTLTIMGAFDKNTVRAVLGHISTGEKIKPEVYHEMQGYSPGKYKTRNIEEDFTGYHFYLAPDPDLMFNSDPQIYFRDAYDYP